MSTITVSIGRNVGTEPMSENEWFSFREAIKCAVKFTDHQILFTGDGEGIWEGQKEDAFTIVAMTVADTNGKMGSDTAWLRDWAGRLGRKYGQDAVAITTGETDLV